MYLDMSRPVITFVVHKLSQFMDRPTKVHLQALCHILHYIKSAPGQGLFFSRDSKIKVQAFSDAD